MFFGSETRGGALCILPPQNTLDPASLFSYCLNLAPKALQLNFTILLYQRNISNMLYMKKLLWYCNYFMMLLKIFNLLCTIHSLLILYYFMLIRNNVKSNKIRMYYQNYLPILYAFTSELDFFVKIYFIS